MTSSTLEKSLPSARLVPPLARKVMADGTEAELARLLGLLHESDVAAARGPAEAILAGGEGFGGDAALAGALTALGLLAWHEGRVADALLLLRAAVTRGDLAPAELRHAYPRIGLAMALTAQGNFDAAAETIAQCEVEMRRLGQAGWTPAVAVLRGRAHLAAGRVADAAAAAHDCSELSRDVGSRIYESEARLIAAAVALLQDDVEQAAAELEASRAGRIAGEVAFFTTTSAWVEARVAEAQKDMARTMKLLEPIYQDINSHKRLLVEEPGAAAWLVRVALAIGDGAKASAIVRAAEQLAADNRDCPWIAAAASHALGLLDGDLASLEDGAMHGLPWARGSASEDAGVLLIERGELGRGRAHLLRALVAYKMAGSVRDEVRVRERLQRDTPKPRVDRPVSGWNSLTATEVRVARWVAQGLTNAQVGERMFLSRHTIDFHLRQIFRKLFVHTRVELTRLVLEFDGQ
jgi:DNA-binding CsgD family transcriptional regulator